MVIVLEHGFHVVGNVAQGAPIERSDLDFLLQNLADQRGHIVAGEDSGRTQFEGPVGEAILGECDRRDLCDVSIIHPTEARVGGPRLCKDPCLDNLAPRGGVILKHHRRVEDRVLQFRIDQGLFHRSLGCQKLARQFGATDIVSERGDEAVARIKEMTNGIGADSVLECVGTQESMMQAIRSTRPGGSVGYVGVPHGVELDGPELFFAHIHLHGGPAPVRRYLPKLIDLVWQRKIDPGDLVLSLDQVAEGYRAMDERRAIKTLLRP
jgi:Zinc-binding dehydrogenase